MKLNVEIHPDYRQSLAFLTVALPQIETRGELVIDGERNLIRKIENHGVIFNVKKFKTPNFFQSWVYRFLRKSKAKRSYEYANKLMDLDVNTPKPVAYFEHFRGGLKESFYVSLQLDYDFDFRVLNHNPIWPNRVEILKQFTAFTFQLHEKGIQFLDHSPGNTLIVSRGDQRYDFYLIDLNRMRFGAMDLNARMKNFRRLWLSKGMIKVMAPKYSELAGHSEEKVKSLMMKYSRKFQKKVNSKKLRKRRRLEL